MSTNKGKAFEQKFYLDWKKSFPNGTIDRIYDSVSGYKTISNVSDFIGYNYPNIFYLECKSHLKNTWNFSYFTQYDKLKEKVGIPGVRAGVVLWMIDHDKVVYLPVSTVTEMKKNGEKSLRGNFTLRIFSAILPHTAQVKTPKRTEKTTLIP